MAASLPTASAGDPFLLPVCSCGGPMNLASLEPHATQIDQELKTYKCLPCGGQEAFKVRKWARNIGASPRWGSPAWPGKVDTGIPKRIGGTQEGKRSKVRKSHGPAFLVLRFVPVRGQPHG